MRSGSASFVAVVQSANLGHCYHSSQLRWLDRPRFRRILLQRKMRPRLVIVVEITRQGSPQRGFAEDDYMVQTLAPNGTYHALHVGPLPRRSRSREHFLSVHVLYLLSESVAENLIAIAEQIARDLIKRKCFAQLLCRPFRRGMRGDIKMDYPAPVMRQHQKHVQHLEADRRHGEEVDGHQVLDVIVQEGTPGLRGRLAVPQHVLGHAGLTDLDAQFEQFPVDMGGAPQPVLTARPAD